ncbi:glycosyltransferase family 4 protein [Polaribacter haliotis]|uniref:Glycosyltransferase family 4 protein n=1 Tax=Polaribacter haliotis TaxID=1888915 RepID=A0A7L8AJ85_9FLAO|nr:glycosyltransferase family 4 protein [Polaribacter haliotis]QOD62066.1 glycosyltransferase family 4 protein [Polaribacter haliotis]
MKTYFLVLIILFALSYLYLRIALKYKIIDKPNKRSSHKKITVRGGGILFPMAIILFVLFNNFQYPYFFAGVFAISIISFLDDIYTLSSKIRFPFQVIAIFLILYQVGVPFEPYYVFVFYLIFGVGIINMFNFMDGINGITGLYSISVLLGFYLINHYEGLINSNLIIYSLIALLVFGFYNFRKKALFFAGDIGSIAIGMLIFFLGMYFTFYLSSPLILLLVIVYGADSGNTLIYRKFFTKESVLEPHRHHIYQKIVDNNCMSHLQVSAVYAIIQIIINVLIFKTYRLELQTQFIIFISLILAFIILYIYLFIKFKRKEII